ncbi:hypothetical protein GCM10027047_18550 [Rhodococcus aerolatus]
MQPNEAGRALGTIEALHSMTYFVPETEAHLTAVGLRPGRMPYFAGRSAPMGAVGAGVVAATFNNFNPALVAKHVPRAWTLASPADVVAARFASVDEALRRLLGDAAAAPEVAEAADLTRRAVEGATVEGRPLFAAHADLEWPTTPLVALWHGITLLREHRGDGHVAALTAAGLPGIDALVSHTASGRGFRVPAAQATRGWSDEQWAASVARLQERGVLDEDGGLTDAGRALRRSVEATTHELGVGPWAHLGDEGTARLVAVAGPLAAAVVAAGTFSAQVFEPGSGRLAPGS